VTATTDVAPKDKEMAKKVDVNNMNGNVMPLIKEADNEDRDQGESVENSEQLTHIGSMPQPKDSGPQFEMY